MDVIVSLDMVLKTMDTIDVCGVDNMDKFVGCAQTVKSVLQELIKKKKEAESKEAAEDNATKKSSKKEVAKDG